MYSDISSGLENGKMGYIDQFSNLKINQKVWPNNRTINLNTVVAAIRSFL